jgi:hypothetical protein
MSKECQEIHKIFNSMNRFKFPFDEAKIPKNGIYIIFEKGEKAHGYDRMVRIGTHTGKDQLRSRLQQHFINENKDRSIFRKNIGRAILNKEHDTFITYWELDLTPKENRDKYAKTLDMDKQKQIEKKVTKYIRDNLSFAVFQVDEMKKRLELESKLISTISACKECKASSNWLGNHSTKEKIRNSGLWQVNELFKESLTETEIRRIFVLLNTH